MGFICTLSLWGRPNVVIVITDDQGYGDLGCTGNPIIQTPAIDQLASESVWLSSRWRCVCASAVSSADGRPAPPRSSSRAAARPVGKAARACEKPARVEGARDDGSRADRG